MRFVLVDRITSLEAGKSISAIKNLSLAEEYLADHFPGFPVLPGVLMIEALVQASGWLMRHTTDFAYSTVLLKQVRGVKFNNFVAPGRTLVLRAEIQKWEEDLCVVQASGTVDNGSAVQGKLTLQQMNLADRDPRLAAADQYQIRKLRETFHQLWQPPAVAST